MSYLKPQTPLQHKDGDYFYPLTTIDQVIMEDGITRLNGADLVSVNTDGAPEGETVKVNADTLNGISADEYATKIFVQNEIAEAQFDGSNLDDIKTYVNNQITNRVIHSGGKNLLNINNPTKKNTIIDSDGSFVESNGFMTYRIPSTGGHMTISFAPQSRFDAIRYASEIDGVITRYSSLSGVTVDASQWDALWISIMPIDDFATNVMVEAGSIATEYEPYYEGLKELTYRGADLVWKNASSGSEFNAQSIPLDLSKYYKVEVEFICANSSDVRVIFPAITGSGRYNCVSDDNRGKLVTRIMRAYSDKLSFNSGYIYSTYGTYTEDDNVMIPLKIYGIKEEFHDCIKS